MQIFNVTLMTESIDGERGLSPCITYLYVLVKTYGTKLVFILTENLSQMCIHADISS